MSAIVWVLQQCLWCRHAWLFDPIDYNLRDSSVHGILQARILKWFAISFSSGSSQPRDRTQISCITGRFFTDWATRKAVVFDVKWSPVTQSCPTLCDPMDYSLPGSSHGIFQARVLEWVAISFSRGSSPSRDQTRVSHIVGRHLTIWATREVCSSVY